MSTALEVARVIPSSQVQVIRSDEHFMPVMQIARAVERYNAIVEFTKQIMKPGKDYGEIPGTDKPTLLKPGAEKLCNFFGLTPKFQIVEKKEDWDGDSPFFYYWYKCQLWRGDHFMGEGDGSANSHESKHRYRWVQESQLPPGSDKSRFEARDGSATEMDFAIEKAETSGKYGKPASYWQAFKDAIANGTAERTQKETKNGKKPAWKIGASVYRVPNPDIADQVNTLQKMSQKRAFIAATLIGCNASEYFTQDMEDLETIQDFGPMPDTGPHPINTQAAADHVANQKLEELRRQQDQRRQETPAAAKPAEQVPVDVMALWARMRDIKSTIEVFGELKKDLIEALDKEAGERVYYGILGKHGVDHANQFKSTKPARNAARDLLDAVKDANTPPVADLSDVPDFLDVPDGE